MQICRKFYIEKESELSNIDFYAKVNIKKDPIVKKKLCM